MKIGIIILSRFSSNRLPGKALMKINGKTVLQYIVERLSAVVETDNIVIATSVEESDNHIETFAKNIGVRCYRGSLENVAERFYNAKLNDWDYAIRINGDNIFLDTNVLKEMLSITEKGNYDFITNVKDRTFPKGMSIEIVKLSYYKSALRKINRKDNYREHVTLYLYENVNENYFYFYNKELPEASGIQMALDTKEDFTRTQEIINCFETSHINYNLKEIYSIWKKYNYE